MDIARAYELAESQPRQIEKDSVWLNEHKSVNKAGVCPNFGNRFTHSYSSKSPGIGNQKER